MQQHGVQWDANTCLAVLECGQGHYGQVTVPLAAAGGMLPACMRGESNSPAFLCKQACGSMAWDVQGEQASMQAARVGIAQHRKLLLPSGASK